jgi:glycosyltransferase involved in cell wall biosynthesis
MSVLKTASFLFDLAVRTRRKHAKTTSSGRDVVFYCGETDHVWGPDLASATHIGGSEEAVIHLSRHLARLGWQVTVFNRCGDRPQFDEGAVYRPFWEFNPYDRQDVVVLWRQFKLLDLDINAAKVFVDLHDAGSPPVTAARLRRVDKIFVRSSFHRTYLAGVPDDKIAIVPNGLDPALLAAELPAKDPFLLVNTSSADRCLDMLPELFSRVRQQVPQARLAWAYGWDTFAAYNKGRPDQMAWMERTQTAMRDAGIDNLGRLSQVDIIALYRRAALYAYPTSFPETDCISVKKAQACGCVPVTTDAGALAETASSGWQIPLRGANPVTGAGGAVRAGIKDAATQAAWVDGVVTLLQSPERRAEFSTRCRAWALASDWPTIALRWDSVLRAPSPAVAVQSPS